MFLSAIFFPLLSFFVCIFFNKILKDKTLNYISCLLLILSVICSLSSILFLGLDNQTTYFLDDWIVSGSLAIDWSINYSILTG